VYYRLLTVDKDGSKSYSNMISLIGNYAQELTIYPNPVITKATILCGRQLLGSRAVLVDDKGRVIKQFTFINTMQTLDLTGLTPGVYQVITQNSKAYQLVKQ
jgi:hypothetical protein